MKSQILERHVGWAFSFSLFLKMKHVLAYYVPLQHVFCEECLCLWFERERTCPLCRSTVIETLRCWKDGTTSAHFQIY